MVLWPEFFDVNVIKCDAQWYYILYKNDCLEKIQLELEYFIFIGLESILVI